MKLCHLLRSAREMTIERWRNCDGWASATESDYSNPAHNPPLELRRAILPIRGPKFIPTQAFFEARSLIYPPLYPRIGGRVSPLFGVEFQA